MNEFFPDAETCIIGGLLLRPEECADALEQLSPDEFSNEYSRKSFEIIVAANKNGKKYDAAILGSTQTDAELKQFALLATNTFISQANFKGYIQTVKDTAQNRRIDGKLKELTYTDAEPSARLSELSRFVESEQGAGKVYQDEMSDRLIKYNDNVYKPFDPSDRIYTGFSRMDGLLNGLRKGSLSYIGAMPTTGKTTFALNILLKAVKEKKRVQLFSLEMSTEQLLDRILANGLYLDINKIDLHELEEEDQHRMSEEIGKLYGMKNLWIIDSEYCFESMTGKIAQFKPELVMVDYMQNIRTIKQFGKKKDQIDYISAEFKRIARQNNCHVMVLSQINRAGEGAKAPRMDDLKESGNLEADGDVIMLMHRPYVQDKTEKFKQSEAGILIDKNKFGKCRKISFSFDGKYQKFTEVESRYDN